MESGLRHVTVRLGRGNIDELTTSRDNRVAPGKAGGNGSPARATLIEARNLPRHVGIIMDGNGRWAAARGQGRSEGHRAGSRTVRQIVRLARRIGLEALTLYAFSFQNWARPATEVAGLMALLHDFLIDERREILDNGIRLAAVGDLAQLPPEVRAVLDQLCADSADNARMTLTLALSYGGQEEIAQAMRTLAVQVAEGKLEPEAIDVNTIRSHIPSLKVGEPDLIIRTGGERRLSNFLLFGSAYAELYFSDRYWPGALQESQVHGLQLTAPSGQAQAD
ncbi:MAG: di-trans,poly-cis-decaprenylcistransferase [Deltaproteobacteria bacterium]|nr:di-trans,poly-cis-decaprenylcistransferase [Deltaproteobacteria bacterium]